VSESSPFRTDGNRSYRWPIEGFSLGDRDSYIEYARVTTLLEGVPKDRLRQWDMGLVANYFTENTDAIFAYLAKGFVDNEFDLDNEWWTSELNYAIAKDEAQDEKRQRWDDGDKMQKTRPKEGQRYVTLLSLTPVERVAKYFKAIPGIELKRLSKLGTDVHTFMEAIACGEVVETVDASIAEHVPHGIAYFKDIPMEFLEVESVVYSDKFGYAGQFDALIKVSTAWLLENTGWQWYGEDACPDFITVMVDYKTPAKGIKPIVALQFALYGGADFIGRADGTKTPMPHIDEYWAVNIRADGYDVVPVTVNAEVFNFALAAREMKLWNDTASDTVLHKPLKTKKAA
jgi:hypothetical protein